MKNENVQIGNRYTRLLVVGLIADKKNPKAHCICDCGAVCYPQRGALKNGRAKSCGCLRREKLLSSAITHNKSKDGVYFVYRHILRRCNNEKDKHYKNYGGRGIKCNYDSFEEFYADVGDKPIGFWIDRIDNEKSYEKGNCQWVPPRKNQENKRVSKFWTIDGVTYESAKKAAFVLGLNTSAVIRGCNGYYKRGKYVPPRKGWSSSLKYTSALTGKVSGLAG